MCIVRQAHMEGLNSWYIVARHWYFPHFHHEQNSAMLHSNHTMCQTMKGAAFKLYSVPTEGICSRRSLERKTCNQPRDADPPLGVVYTVTWTSTYTTLSPYVEHESVCTTQGWLRRVLVDHRESLIQCSHVILTFTPLVWAAFHVCQSLLAQETRRDVAYHDKALRE